MNNPLDPFPEELTNDAALALFAADDREAVALGFVREAVRYTRKVCRGGLEDGELISVCFAALQQAAKNYDPARGRFFAFAKQYLRGAVAREWSKKDVVKNSRADNTEGSDVAYKTLEASAVELPDFGSIYTREEWELLYPAIQKRLNDVERMVIVLRYKAGFSFEEIGELRGVTRQAIQRTHRGAIQKLHLALTHKQEKL